ncbi:MAG: hypothetical protein WCX89_13965 [Acidithiobacillus thiooxidans]
MATTVDFVELTGGTDDCAEEVLAASGDIVAATGAADFGGATTALLVAATGAFARATVCLSVKKR